MSMESPEAISPNAQKPEEQPRALTREEQAAIEKSRARDMEIYGDVADSRNRQRSLADKVRGKDKLTDIDIAHESALKMNEEIDRNKQWKKDWDAKEKETNEIKDRIYSSEMQLANQGEWDWYKSRVKEEDRVGQLKAANGKALDAVLNREKKLVESGKWNAESSALNVPNFDNSRASYVEQAKHQRFAELKELQRQQDRAQKEKEEQELLKSLTEKSTAEKTQVEAGQWNAGGSYLRQVSFDVTVSRRVSATAERMFKELVAYESKLISDKERVKVGKEYAKEEALAKQGKWTNEASYFSAVQKDPRFQKFDDALRRDIQSKVSNLGMLNWGSKNPGGHKDPFKEMFGEDGRFTGNPFGREYARGGTNGRQAEEDGEAAQIKKARNILGINSKTTFDDAKKAYRKFMMQNHPDRNPEGVSKEIAEQIRDLTQVWPVLEEHLKKQKA